MDLHKIAHLEAQKKLTAREILQMTEKLLAENIDIHQVDENGDTAFNIAASASPIIGRILTNYWLAGKSSKALDEKSGSHNSTLPQYVAKWSSAQEIDKQLDYLIAQKINIAAQNSSGWTPLHAACAMAFRAHAVEAFAKRYSKLELNLRTFESYQTKYNESPEIIFYAENLTALEIAKSRLEQGKTLPMKIKMQFENYLEILR